MYMLTTDCGGYALAGCGRLNTPLILKARLVLNQVPLRGVVVTVIELAMLDATDLGSVCLGEDFTVMDRLDSAVVVVLVNLLVNGSVDLLVLVRLDRLVLDSRGNRLVDGCVVVTGAAHEVGDSCLRLIHFD